MNTCNVGDVVAWRAGGKVSRLDGVAGKKVTGTVVEVQGADLVVRGHYPSLVELHLVPVSKVLHSSGSPMPPQ